MKFRRSLVFAALILVALVVSVSIQSAGPIAATSFAAIGFLGFPEERVKPQKQHAALEIVTGFTTAANTTYTGLGGGDFSSGIYQVKNFTPGTKAWLLNVWSHFQANVPKLRISSPALHDAVSPLLFRPISSQTYCLMSNGSPQELVAQDKLLFEHQGSATAGDIESTSALIYYQDLKGSNSAMIDEDQLDELFVDLATVEVPITAGTAGGYSGSAALNSGVYTLKNNTRYAILGGHSSVLQCSIGLTGIDFGNLKIGFPGNANDKDVNTNFFVEMSRAYAAQDKATGLIKKFPIIPTFNSGNSGGINVVTVNNENAASPVVTLLLARLNG